MAPPPSMFAETSETSSSGSSRPPKGAPLRIGHAGENTSILLDEHGNVKIPYPLLVGDAASVADDEEDAEDLAMRVGGGATFEKGPLTLSGGLFRIYDGSLRLSGVYDKDDQESFRVDGGNAVFSEEVHVGNRLVAENCTVKKDFEVEEEGRLMVKGSAHFEKGLAVGEKNDDEKMFRVSLPSLFDGRVHSRDDVRTESNVYVFGRQGVGTDEPLADFHISGGVAPENEGDSGGSNYGRHAFLDRAHLLVSGKAGFGASIASSNAPSELREALHVGPGDNAKFEGRAFVMGGLGVGTSNLSPVQGSSSGGARMQVDADASFTRKVTLGNGSGGNTIELENGNLTVEGNVYAMSRHGVGTDSPAEVFHVGGGPEASNNARFDRNVVILGKQSVGGGEYYADSPVDAENMSDDVLHVRGGSARVDGDMFVESGLIVGRKREDDNDDGVVFSVRSGRSRFDDTVFLGGAPDWLLSPVSVDGGDEPEELPPKPRLYVAPGEDVLVDSRLGIGTKAALDALHVSSSNNGGVIVDGGVNVSRRFALGPLLTGDKEDEGFFLDAGMPGWIRGGVLSVVDGGSIRLGTKNATSSRFGASNGPRLHVSDEDGHGNDVLIDGFARARKGLASRALSLAGAGESMLAEDLAVSTHGGDQERPGPTLRVAQAREPASSSSGGEDMPFHQAFYSTDVVSGKKNLLGIGSLYPKSGKKSSDESIRTVIGTGTSPKDVETSARGLFMNGDTGYVGVGEASPRYRLHVGRGILKDDTGVLAPTLALRTPDAYQDVRIGSALYLDGDIEAGNPATAKNGYRPPLFAARFFDDKQEKKERGVLDDHSGVGDRWTLVRFLCRGVLLTDIPAAWVTLRLERSASEAATETNDGSGFAKVEDFDVDMRGGQAMGYRTFTTPWTDASSHENTAYAVRFMGAHGSSDLSSDVKFRFGSVHAQFSSSTSKT